MYESVKMELEDLPEDVQEEVLLRLDLESIEQAHNVSCGWRNIVFSSVFWKRKLHYHNIQLPSSFLHNKELDWRVYYSVLSHYLHNATVPYDRNLLRNGSGEMEENNSVQLSQGNRNEEDFDEDWFKHWFIWSSSGQGWRIFRDGESSYFATSSISCSKMQVVSLVEAGVDPVVLDEYQPDICVGEEYSSPGRGATYELKVDLLDGEGSVVGEHSERHNLAPGTGTEWRRAEHVFTGYGAGVRGVRLYHGGFGGGEGWWGTRMRGARVLVTFPQARRQP